MSIKNYSSITRYNFESSVITLIDKTRIQLSPDALSEFKVDFNLDLTNSQNFYHALLYCSSLLLDIKEDFVEDKHNYSLWKESALINSIARTLKEEEKKPEHLREDLNVIIQRREDIADRIHLQINHFNKYQDQIQKTQIKHNKHFHQYNPLIFAIYPDSLILEAIQENGKFYVRYELHRSVLLFNDLPEMGCAFIEFNYQFHSELISRINILNLGESNSLQIISSSWSEKDYLKRPQSVLSRRRINFKPKLINSYIQSPIVEYLYNNENNVYVNNIVLEKIAAFDFIHIIENQYSIDEIVTINVSTKPGLEKISIQKKDEMIIILMNGENETNKYFKLHANSVKNLYNLVHLIDSMTITYIYQFFPVKVTLNLKEDRINLIQYFKTTKYEDQLFQILIRYQTFKYDKTRKTRLLAYVKDNQSVNENEIQFSFKFNEEELHSAIADLLLTGKVMIDDITKKLRFRDPFTFPSEEVDNDNIQNSDFMNLASAMSDLFEDYIIIDDIDNGSKFTVHGFQFQPNIILDNRGRVISVDCSCNLNRKQNPCYHIFALHIAVIRGGL
ncbi:MAG: hypothetical protein GPJ54_12965 [Candidatus Heimdallarchaeota archaeon]|nr:hypothetical protein [Candidatus Heimdallarchaeota archaeon]